MKKVVLGAAAAVLLLSANAMAEENYTYRPYVGLDYVYSNANAEGMKPNYSSAAINFGTMYNKYFGTELFYQYSDKDKNHNAEHEKLRTSFQAGGLDMYGYLPLGCEQRFSLLGTAGVGMYKFRKSYSSLALKGGNDSGYGYRLGAGMMYAQNGDLVMMRGGLDIQARLIVWIFAMRLLMILTSVVAYWLNGMVSKIIFGNKKAFNFETPLTSLIWLTSLISILVTFGVSYVMIGGMDADLWWKLSVIISCGTLAAALIPEFTKIFTSSKSKHVEEVVNASREAGASLNIISGIVAGNFSAFWQGLVMVGLMAIAFFTARSGLDGFMVYPTVFAFGLVAFGMLGMGPVTIAVDSYGPVTDNAQSVFELSQIESIKGIHKEIEKDYGFKPDFEGGKHFLEENDSAGNTFKATAKPVLIGTAVIGATTMIFSIILLLNLQLNLLDPEVLFGIILGGAVIFWFSGASMQAVSTGAYRAVNYIKKHIKLDTAKAASIDDSKKVVQICTLYAQKGMFNIFIVIFSFTIAFACFDANLFASYLISIAVFGLFQALYMANAGGAWDNAKKVVEVDLNEKGTPLHDASVVGDTVGDPYKDTSSVALNPIIKFTTLFGLLAVEMAVAAPKCVSVGLGVLFFVIGLIFVWRSFYAMRIEPAAKD